MLKWVVTAPTSSTGKNSKHQSPRAPRTNDVKSRTNSGDVTLDDTTIAAQDGAGSRLVTRQPPASSSGSSEANDSVLDNAGDFSDNSIHDESDGSDKIGECSVRADPDWCSLGEQTILGHLSEYGAQARRRRREPSESCYNSESDTTSSDTTSHHSECGGQPTDATTHADDNNDDVTSCSGASSSALTGMARLEEANVGCSSAIIDSNSKDATDDLMRTLDSNCSNAEHSQDETSPSVDCVNDSRELNPRVSTRSDVTRATLPLTSREARQASLHHGDAKVRSVYVLCDWSDSAVCSSCSVIVTVVCTP